MSREAQPSNMFVSYEEELKKLYTLVGVQADVDRLYILEKLKRSCNRIPLTLHPNVEEMHRAIWGSEPYSED